MAVVVPVVEHQEESPEHQGVVEHEEAVAFDELAAQVELKLVALSVPRWEGE